MTQLFAKLIRWNLSYPEGRVIHLAVVELGPRNRTIYGFEAPIPEITLL